MSFYVTLPSNGADLKSEYGMATNTQTNYFINLKQPLDLSITDYEVALVEFIYPLKWQIDLAEIKIIELETSFLLSTIHLRCDDGEKVVNIISIINFEIQKVPRMANKIIHFMYDEKNRIIVLSVSKGLKIEIKGFLAEILSNRITTVRASNQEKDLEKEIDVIFNKAELLKEIVDTNNLVKQGTEFFTHDKILEIEGSDNIFEHFFLKSNKIQKIKELFIYTNIIENQYVGEDMTKLFKIFPVRDNDNNNTGFESVFLPNYVNVSQKIINRINIKIADSTGNKINFSDSRSSVIPKLHFRPRRF